LKHPRDLTRIRRKRRRGSKNELERRYRRKRLTRRSNVTGVARGRKRKRSRRLGPHAGAGGLTRRGNKGKETVEDGGGRRSSENDERNCC